MEARGQARRGRESSGADKAPVRGGLLPAARAVREPAVAVRDRARQEPGADVVAEGVQTKEQLEFLSKLKCDEYQGYYFSKPVPPEQIAGLLESRLAGSAAAS